MKCAVLGDPIDHSLSPVLHRAAYAELEMSEWSYTSTRVAAGALASHVESLGGDWPPSRWRGLSVTMPLKREAFELARSVSPRARLVGAVNTLVRSSHGWVGDNTDLPGAVAAIRERAGAEAACASGVILGAGATAASTGLALAELGASRITLLARNPGAAGETIEMISRHPSKPIVSVLSLDSAAPDSVSGGVDAVVSTIPAKAQTAEVVARWASAPVVFDVVYDPWPSPLLEATSGVAVSGLDLLVHQAGLQFELFTGRPAPLAAMRAAGEKALGITEPSPA
ncbi:shikimate dehydrogenase [Nocardioides albertanoniae]|uniref:Shikimate dehydrogenase n=1 Tax=Nocardioides albertanoniae TaxID=1175486 RepID=A0A543A755_9ACTN|nr:shikimate dehydrogenase [Nocardioides albertanoniae]TQL68306.1 shikimate dehydrogenase [Nocardioides albertanoniae]